MEIYPDPREQAKLMLVGYLNMAEVLAHHFKNEIEIRNVVLQKCAGFMAGLLPKVDSLVL